MLLLSFLRVSRPCTLRQATFTGDLMRKIDELLDKSSKFQGNL
jgi:hypothetical protein